ncbi:MAG: DmsE family decaheme c-type cytochrome [Magnetococcus sp. DMHC-6]
MLHKLFLAIVIMTLLLGLGSTHAWADEDDDDDYKEPPKKHVDTVLRGDAECTFCHEEEDSPSLLRIGKTKHGALADARTPTCTSCHGLSRDHLKKPKGSEKRTKPDVTFPRRNPSILADYNIDDDFGNFKLTETPVDTRNGVCMSCHKGDKLMFWSSSAHAAQEVACTTCHEMHTDRDRVMQKESQPKVCFGCHKTQRALFNRPSHHPVPEGQMVCTDCHNPHGSAGIKSLKKDSVNDTCYQCHMEKRGPFVHMHPPVMEDCRICHNPHGTSIAGLLNSRPPYLCQECHSDNRHPGQVAGLPDGRTNNTSLLGTIARGCVKCHTNIHGSNSTENATRAGRYHR